VSDTLRVYGASDDLLELVDAIDDEFYPADPDTLVIAGYIGGGLVEARLRVEYDHDGIWRLTPTNGHDLVAITPARGDDEPDDEHGCPGYSDKATVTLDKITTAFLLSGMGAA